MVSSNILKVKKNYRSFFWMDLFYSVSCDLTGTDTGRPRSGLTCLDRHQSRVGPYRLSNDLCRFYFGKPARRRTLHYIFLKSIHNILIRILMQVFVTKCFSYNLVRSWIVKVQDLLRIKYWVINRTSFIIHLALQLSFVKQW